jgi:hypothetical protein
MSCQLVIALLTWWTLIIYVSGLRAVFISRLSRLLGNDFNDNETTPHASDIYDSDFIRTLNDIRSESMSGTCHLNDLVYVPTAAYSTILTSQRSPGEARRRAKYDARQKLKFLANILPGVTGESKLLELDLPDMTKSKIEETIQHAAYIYVDGGNTFYLQKYCVQHSFFDCVRTYCEEHDGCVYIGASAGGIVAGKQLDTAYWKGWDDPSIVDCDFATEEYSRGGELSMYSIFPHYDEKEHSALVKDKRTRLVDPTALRTIADNEFIVV